MLVPPFGWHIPELKGSLRLRQQFFFFFLSQRVACIPRSHLVPRRSTDQRIKRCHVRQGEMLLFDRTINECIQFSYQTWAYEDDFKQVFEYVLQ